MCPKGIFCGLILIGHEEGNLSNFTVPAETCIITPIIPKTPYAFCNVAETDCPKFTSKNVRQHLCSGSFVVISFNGRRVILFAAKYYPAELSE